jgi:arginyl-tRNA synthetase
MSSSSSLARAVARALHAALPTQAGLSEADVEGLLETPPDQSLGDLAFPCFRLAKSLRRPPPEIAVDLASAVEKAGIVDSATAVGPYVNLRLSLPEAGRLVLPEFALGIPEPAPWRPGRVMVEYSQPNTHKAFHVGHMRNLCLGDALARLLRADGYEVVAANYLGDVGTHIARWLWWYLDELSEEQRTPPDRHRGEWLGQLYADATDQIDRWEEATKAGDDEAKERLSAARARITEILKQLEARDPELTSLWRTTRQWSIDEFEDIYAWSGVTFDRVFSESEVDEPGLALVQEFLDKGVFVESEGAVGVVNEEVEHMPFFMLRKRDGTSLYATKDLALAKLKFEEHQVERSIYVVDYRQVDHFRHVFLTLTKMGFSHAANCEHVPYETVELPDGAISARKGNVILFRTLRETMTSYVRDNYLEKYRGEWDDAEIDEVAHTIALGAIKYGMLARDVNQRIVFDMEAWLDLEGNTGPYLQYACARIRSIIRKSAAEGKTLDPTVLEDESALRAACVELSAAEEREVVLALDGLNRAVSQAAEQLRPSALCTYLFGIAKAYNRFNKACNVKQSTGARLQARLLVVHATVEALSWGLGRLGIPAPQRM